MQGNTAANGTFVVTVLDGNNFELDGSTGSGAYVGFDHCGACGEACDAGLVCVGHSHQEMNVLVNGAQVVNAGSVGMPFGDPGAAGGPERGKGGVRQVELVGPDAQADAAAGQEQGGQRLGSVVRGHPFLFLSFL